MALSCRTSFLAGRSYPGDEAGLRAFMEGMLGQGQEPAGWDHVKGIIAPHIDYARGADVYCRAYKFLPVEENTLFVIFGTCHKPVPKVWNIALRDLKTPLGTVKGASVVGRLVREDVLLGTYVDEWPHRNEHSIELQLPIIQSVLGHDKFEVLSILTGSLHESNTLCLLYVSSFGSVLLPSRSHARRAARTAACSHPAPRGLPARRNADHRAQRNRAAAHPHRVPRDGP